MVDMRTWMSVDYYHVLRIPRTASVDTIRKAYRSLAKEYHPDKGGEERAFHAVSEAYEVLNDPELKNQYDAVRTVAGSQLLDEERFMELVKEAFREGFTEGVDRWRKGKLNRVRGHDIRTKIVLTAQEAEQGTVRPLMIVYETGCPDCMNGCDHCENGWLTEEKILTVKIPAGVKNGKRIKIAKAGGKGEKPGDLYIVVDVLPGPAVSGVGDMPLEESKTDSLEPELEPEPAPELDHEFEEKVVPEMEMGTNPVPEPVAEPEESVTEPEFEEKTVQEAEIVPPFMTETEQRFTEASEPEPEPEPAHEPEPASEPEPVHEERSDTKQVTESTVKKISEEKTEPSSQDATVADSSEGTETAETDISEDGKEAETGNKTDSAALTDPAPPTVSIWKKEMTKPVLRRRVGNKKTDSAHRAGKPSNVNVHLPTPSKPFFHHNQETVSGRNSGDPSSRKEGKLTSSSTPPIKRSRPPVHIRVESPDYFPLNVDRGNLGKQVTFISPRGENIVFVVPKGVKDAQVLRIKGKGRVNPDTLVVEDLLLQVFLVGQ